MINENENKRKYSFGYEDLDKNVEVEIFGLKFEIDVNEIEEMGKNGSANLSLDEQIDRCLGNGAFEKINKKRLQDGYDELNAIGKTKVLGYIMEVYTKELSGNIINPVKNVIGTQQEQMNNYNNKNMNRAQRRYNERYNRRRRY